ncbi:hypothetical protein LOK49_LG10G00125 [Camellia lanceoleosa]|uniref:Uncharacterized protein n=1 Tax=Camellia lanceoleosa TaxID=1840588 RepID=A0ACC0G9N6_9ERIC|nr:hypothetical protein LOK49_LG10G00125 [Camellia lanceoleosa]
MLFFLFLVRADYGDLQFFNSRCETEVSQHFLEASHCNDLKSTLGCISDRFDDVNFLLCHNELANEVRVEYEEFKTDVTVFFLAIHAGTVTLFRKLLTLHDVDNVKMEGDNDIEDDNNHVQTTSGGSEVDGMHNFVSSPVAVAHCQMIHVILKLLYRGLILRLRML